MRGVRDACVRPSVRPARSGPDRSALATLTSRCDVPGMTIIMGRVCLVPL